MMKKHFVVFMSPGTFFHEESRREIDSWNVDQAVEMARTIVERYGATPFGFYFITKGRKDDELDSKIIANSPMYYLGGKVESLEEIKERGDPKEDILIMNMESNGWNQVIVNSNSWEVVQPLKEGDVVLEFTPH